MPFDLHTPSFLALLALLVACSSEPASQKTSNRLIRESSPYLQQHAHNPVDWYPWGPEALKRARQTDRLLIISIGYAACHWCHVMERETFADTAVARLMNARFVSVKVDREERPDVDAIYLAACRLSGAGACGWPLNAIALPDGRPLWVGTYLPRDDWQEVLRFFRDAWPAERANMETFADRLTGALQPEAGDPRPAQGDWSRQSAEAALSSILARWDRQYGGRQGAPKFPMPGLLDLLLRYHGLSGAEEPLDALQLTLDQMAKGGLHDQLAGGFSRYATDVRWRIPHFEKMLYDNAMLLSIYARAWQRTGRTRYREAAEGIGHWLLAEMRSGEGGYYASLDADDAKGEEGAYYSWSLTEVRQLLGDLAPLAEAWYDLSEQGNRGAGKNILYCRRSLPVVADSLGIPLPLAREQLKEVRTRMLEARRKRRPPSRDEKIITAWNALLVRGMASAYRAMGDTVWRNEALRLGRFLIRRQQNPEGGLFRIRKDGRSYGHAFLDDYAFLAAACLDLYEITFDTNWIAHAQGLADHALRHFDDPDAALLFYSSRGDPSLIVRLKETEDGVIPSSNAVFAGLLFRLGKLLDDTTYARRSRSMVLAMRPDMEAEPFFFYRWWQLYLQQAYPFPEIAVVGPAADSLRAQLQAHYLPQTLWMGGMSEGSLPLLRRKLVPGQTTIYVCRNKVCQRPVTRAEQALDQIKGQFPALR